MGRTVKFNPKRRFRGNQHTSKSSNGSDNERRLMEADDNNPEKGSASKRKMFVDDSCLEEDIQFEDERRPGNIIVDLNCLSDLVKGFVACKSCHKKDCVEITEQIESRRGLSSKIIILCTRCNDSNSSMSSPFNNKKLQDVNIRMVYAMRCIGKGRKAAQTFCAVMNLPPPPTRFQNYTKVLMKGLGDVSENSMKEAAKEAVAENEESKDISVALDGSWQKRGHTSLNGIVSAICVDTGKVIDIECLSKYCVECAKGTEHECKKNYEGSSGGMEAVGAVRIFKRSMATRDGVRCVTYLGDGDSKGFMKVCEAKPYGDNVQIQKLECVGHVQKRLGARLRRLRKEYKGKKLTDGKSITGRGRLTDSAVDLLQTYYGLAIRRNSGNLQAMRRAVWATYFHKLSTDEINHHGLCPKGADSWCGFQKAASTGAEYVHKNSLPLAVMDVIKPIYRDLSVEGLLKKCLHGGTQNCNESLNNCIWERIPKNIFVGIDTLKIGVMDAVITFNDGASSRLKVLKSIGIEPGTNAERAFRAIDTLRIQEAEIAAAAVTKEARVANRNKRRVEEDEAEDDHTDYAAGMH